MKGVDIEIISQNLIIKLKNVIFDFAGLEYEILMNINSILFAQY